MNRLYKQLENDVSICREWANFKKKFSTVDRLHKVNQQSSRLQSPDAT